MNREINKAISLTEIIGIIRRRKWLVVISLLFTLAPALIYNHKSVPIFRGSTKLIFQNSDKAMENYAFGGMNQVNFISNQIEEMKTELFAEDVYSELSADYKSRFLQLSSFRPDMNAESFVISQIKNNLSFAPIRGTEIINIGFDTEKPDLAQVVANTTAEVVITRNLRMRRQQFSNVKNFVDEQFEIVQRRLAAAERSLKEFKERQKITSIEDESREILQRSSKAEIVYNEVKTTKNELQERLAAIQEQLRSEKRDLTKNVVNTTSPLAAKLKEQLVEMEITYSNLQVQGFPQNNPKMIDLKNEIAQVKQTLVQETLKINQDENMESLIDPFSQIKKHMEESIALEVELQAAKAKEANLEVLLASYARVLSQLPAKELTLVRLLRDKEVNQSLYMTLVQEREKARINEASEIGNIRILESASLPGNPVRPRKALNIAVAVLAGCFLGIAFVFLLEYVNDKIRIPDDVERDVGFPVIAVIPKSKKELDGIFRPDKNGRMGTTSFYDSIFFDAYNLLSFALDKNQNTAKTVMVTSATPNEGKTSISSMLAITSAQRGKRTLLIDADLRKPSLDAYFRIPREPGLTNLVIEIMQMQRRQRPVGRNGHQALPPPIKHNGHDIQLVQHQMIQAALVEGLVQTFEKNLLLLPCGFIPSNPVRVWSSAIWNTIFHHLNSLVDLIIIDAPPIIGVAETTMMAVHVENILFCIAAGGVDKKTLKRSFKMFGDSVPNAEEKIVGAVLNKADMVDTFGGFKYYYRYHSKKENTRRTPEAPRVDFRPPTIGVTKRIS